MSKQIDIKWMAHRIAALLGMPIPRANAFVKRAVNTDGTLTVFGETMDALRADKFIRQLEEGEDDD